MISYWGIRRDKSFVLENGGVQHGSRHLVVTNETRLNCTFGLINIGTNL